MSENCLDKILIETGEFGRYQRRITVLIMFAVITTFFSVFVWLFEAKQINHRCEIVGCETDTQFKPPWWPNGIPSINDQPAQCTKYKRINSSSEGSCNASDFNPKEEEPCDNYVYETQERSIVQDFNLHCQDNLWKLSFVGTINSIGCFVGLPLSGILSDKYGRKTILIGTSLLTGVAGYIRSFSQSYTFFLVMEFFDAVFSSGSFAACFILGLELVGPSQRSLITVLISVFYSVGGVIIGSLAWLIQTWRPLVQILYALFFIIGSYYWLVPESVRWLITQKRYSDAEKVLQKLAKTNGTSISEENIKTLYYDEGDVHKSFSLREMFKSLTLTKRFINCSFCWLAGIFVYQGFTVYSVGLSGNSYLDFILTMAIEIPGCILTYKLLESLGRRLTLAGSLFVCSAACIAFIFIPKDIYWLRLTMYLIGKLGISINLIVIYPVTSEIFPTCLRSSLLSTCSMIGRIGAILSPQVTLLMAIWDPLPLILFAIVSLVTGLLSLLFPETKDTKLPDTIAEAKYIGRPMKTSPTCFPLVEKDKTVIECENS